MTVNRKLILPLFYVIACLGNATAFSQINQTPVQPTKYRAVELSVKTTNGSMSALNMLMVFKDKYGFVWIASSNEEEELYRYDGKEFRKFIPEPNKPGSIHSTQIWSFKEDSLHNIWLGTEKGLSMYDIRYDTFMNIHVVDSISKSSRMAPFWVTEKELYCKGPGPVITVIDTRKFSVIRTIRLKGDIDPEIRWNSYKSIFDKNSNCFWQLAEISGTIFLQQIFMNGEIKNYIWPCTRKNIQHQRHGAEDMQFDVRRNSIWINSSEGLLEFSLRDKKFRQVERVKFMTAEKNFDRFVGIDVDKHGRVWFSTNPFFLQVYNPETNQLFQPIQDSVEHRDAGAHVIRIYCDRDDIVWSSNYMGNGLYKLLPYDPPLKRYSPDQQHENKLSSRSVSTMIPGPGGKLWLGTNAGLNIFDPETEKFEILTKKDLPGISGNIIIPLIIDTIKQKALIRAGSMSTMDMSINLYIMDLKNRVCRKIKFDHGYNANTIYGVDNFTIKKYKNNILICDAQYGIWEINNYGLFAKLVVPFKKTMDIGEAIVDGDYLFIKCSQNKEAPNLTFVNRAGIWNRTSHYLDSVSWGYILVDNRDQSRWISFKYELVHYDKHLEKIKSYSEKDGYTNVRSEMLMDNAGNIWFKNAIGQICRFQTSTERFTTLSEGLGYTRQIHWNTSAGKDASGNLYFGSRDTATRGGGLDQIFPNKYKSDNNSSVYIRSIDVNQKPLAGTPGFNAIGELKLAHNENFITIGTGIIDHYANGTGHIRYKFGIDTNQTVWQYGPAYHSIRYENLSPGRYQLLMQASNAQQEFTGSQKEIIIHIVPAFWQTWWFRILAVVFTLGIFYFVIRYFTRQKFKLQLERSEKETQMAEMRQNTAELQQQKTEIEMQALRAQMNPHFIFNSLNSINRFILQNDKAQASEYLTKFSRLVRLILQNSQSSMISLESELESLRLYLDLEAVRFERRFAYSITVPKDMDIEILKVPPLIIQPYTENAIWHGLMHKEDKGQLDINVSEENDYLVIRVADNGIGREAARAISGKSATKHKSFGMKITANRIAMLEKSFDGISPVTINDLTNPDGSPAGTEVVIRIPITV